MTNARCSHWIVQAFPGGLCPLAPSTGRRAEELTVAGTALGLTGVVLLLVVAYTDAACDGISRSSSLVLSPGPSRSARSTISSSSNSTIRVPPLPVAKSQCGGEWLCLIIRGLSSGDRGVVGAKKVISSSVSAFVSCSTGDKLLLALLLALFHLGAMPRAGASGRVGPGGTGRRPAPTSAENYAGRSAAPGRIAQLRGAREPSPSSCRYGGATPLKHTEMGLETKRTT